MQYIFGWHMAFGQFGYKVVWSGASFVICCKLLDLILYHSAVESCFFGC